MKITFEYLVENNTNCDLYEFRITEALAMSQDAVCEPFSDFGIPVTPLTYPGAPGAAPATNKLAPSVGTWWGILEAGDGVYCKSEYTTTSTNASISNQVWLDSRW